MSTRGRSTSPRPATEAEMDVDQSTAVQKPDAKVVIITNLTRNVVESHLQTIFGFYGPIIKIDLPLFGKCERQLYLFYQLNVLKEFHFSGPKPRESSVGIRRPSLRPQSRISHGWWTAGRRYPQSRTLRPSSPLPLAVPNAPCSSTASQWPRATSLNISISLPLPFSPLPKTGRRISSPSRLLPWQALRQTGPSRTRHLPASSLPQPLPFTVARSPGSRQTRTQETLA